MTAEAVTMTAPTPTPPAVGQQSAKLLGHYAGYIATWAIDLGQRAGLLETLATLPEGSTPERLAARLELDPLYTRVWCRSAYAAGVLDLVETEETTYRLAPHMATLLLNADSPAYLGGLARALIAMRETFVDMREFIQTGQREWWKDFDTEWIQAVGDTGQAFYRRMLDIVIPKLPAVEAELQAGARVLDLACGVCRGPMKIARAYPTARFTAVDGDAYTLGLARENLALAELDDRFELLHSPLEELALSDAYDIAIINISLHEARNIERVVANARRALRPGGTFLVSEFPFPETLEGSRALPGQIMSGIQFFEAHIGCQLLPTSRFVELLEQAGFREVGTMEVTPVHVVIHGTK